MRNLAGARLTWLVVVGAVLAGCASGAQDMGVGDGAPDGVGGIT